MTVPAIAVRNVWKYYGDFAAIRDVTLNVRGGCILALLGRNGAGKTTLLRMMGGLLQPTHGTIEAGNFKDKQRGTKTLIGIVGHGQWLYDDLTAQENLAFFARLYGIERADTKIEHWLEVTALSSFRHTRLGEFSQGMRQRLSIARAFLHEPKILLLDEPWTALDDQAMSFLSSLLLEAHTRQNTIVVCSHQLRETLAVATDLAVIERGRIIFNGPNTDELKVSPQDFYQRIA